MAKSVSERKTSEIESPVPRNTATSYPTVEKNKPLAFLKNSTESDNEQ